MTDLINRSAVLKILSNEFDMAAEERAEADNEKDRTFNAGEIHCARRSTRKVNELPTIDAVPVVRCKDCIHRDRAMRCIALYYGFNPYDEWFCANGTRMDDEKSEEGTNGHQTD